MPSDTNYTYTCVVNGELLFEVDVKIDYEIIDDGHEPSVDLGDVWLFGQNLTRTTSEPFFMALAGAVRLEAQRDQNWQAGLLEFAGWHHRGDVYNGKWIQET